MYLEKLALLDFYIQIGSLAESDVEQISQADPQAGYTDLYQIEITQRPDSSESGLCCKNQVCN
jgi:hypothetical protein